MCGKPKTKDDDDMGVTSAPELPPAFGDANALISACEGPGDDDADAVEALIKEGNDVNATNEVTIKH